MRTNEILKKKIKPGTGSTIIAPGFNPEIRNAPNLIGASTKAV